MKHILFFFLLAGCASVPEQKISDATLCQELTEMTETLENLSYAVHKPIYNIPDNE